MINSIRDLCEKTAGYPQLLFFKFAKILKIFEIRFIQSYVYEKNVKFIQNAQKERRWNVFLLSFFMFFIIIECGNIKTTDNKTKGESLQR